MIDKNKTYRTRNGREVRIYTTEHSEPHSVVGAIQPHTEETTLATWTSDGTYSIGNLQHPHDLIEVKPRIKRTVWLSVYPGYCTAHNSLQDSDDFSNTRTFDKQLARVKVEIDCEEGEGLD